MLLLQTLLQPLSYSPPHDYEIDFPRLMVAWKKQRVAEGGALMAGQASCAHRFYWTIWKLDSSHYELGVEYSWVRGLVERVLGIHKDRQILPFEKESFYKWWGKHKIAKAKTSPKAKVVLFPSCMVNHQATDIGKATFRYWRKTVLR